MTTPGWYNDEADDRLARWHDGQGWTEHTLVKAEWTGAGQPPPPGAEPTVWLPPAGPEPTTVLPAAPPPPATPPPAPSVTPAGVGVVDRYRAWPLWARVAAPAAAALFAIGAATGGSGDGSDRAETTGTSSTSTTSRTVEVQVVSLDDAIAEARLRLDPSVDDARLGELIRSLCDGNVGSAATLATGIAQDTEELRTLIDAAGDGAEAHCPEDIADGSNLLNDVFSAALVVIEASADDPTTTVATTAPRARTSSPAPPTTQAPATTQPPATSPTTQPPATSPPAPDPPPSGSVHPGSFCTPAGSTGFASAGHPMTCSTAKCDGTPYEQPRWRSTAC